MNLRNLFRLRTVRQKLIMISKIAGIILIISYIISTRLPVEPDISLWIWLFFVTALVLALDYLMRLFISNPVAELSRAAASIRTMISRSWQKT